MSPFGFGRDPFGRFGRYPGGPPQSTRSYRKELAMGVIAVIVLMVAFLQTRPDAESSASNRLRFDENAAEKAKTDREEKELTKEDLQRALDEANKEQVLHNQGKTSEDSKANKRTTSTPSVKSINPVPNKQRASNPTPTPAPAPAPKPAPAPAPAPAPKPAPKPKPAKPTLTANRVRALPNGASIESVKASLGSSVSSSDMKREYSDKAVRALLRQEPEGRTCRYYALAPSEPAPYVRLCFDANGRLLTRDFVAPVG